jgi:lipopolysaccharide export LptBFGC system permease protein LptF
MKLITIIFIEIFLLVIMSLCFIFSNEYENIYFSVVGLIALWFSGYIIGEYRGE